MVEVATRGAADGAAGLAVLQHGFDLVAPLRRLRRSIGACAERHVIERERRVVARAGLGVEHIALEPMLILERRELVEESGERAAARAAIKLVLVVEQAREI